MDSSDAFQADRAENVLRPLPLTRGASSQVSNLDGRWRHVVEQSGSEAALIWLGWVLIDAKSLRITDLLRPHERVIDEALEVEPLAAVAVGTFQ
jgi:hypothetical protein